MSRKKRVTKSETLTTEVVDVVHLSSKEDIQKKVVGLTLEEAEKVALAVFKKMRITCEDGNYRIGTCDYNLERLNVEVEKGIVVRTAIG